MSIKGLSVGNKKVKNIKYKNVDIDIGGESENCIVSFNNLGNVFNYTRHNNGINLNIPSRCTELGNYCFYYCDGLKEIEIPNTITKIGDYAFAYCNGLESVTIPNSVTYIGNYAFGVSNKLESIIIPSSVTYMGGSCFQNCSSLKECTLSSNMTSVQSNTFYNCGKLTKVVMPTSLTAINSSAFYSCILLELIDIPNTVTSITGSAFRYCKSLLNVNIPSAVTSIGNTCFDGCTGLLGYELNWTDSSKILSYDSTKMPLPTGAIIVIPNDTTSLYIAKNYPSSSLVEKGDIEYNFIKLSENTIAYNGNIKLKMRLIYGVDVCDDVTLTMTGSNNETYTATTDDYGVAIFDITGLNDDVDLTVSYNGTSITYQITYAEALYVDLCDDDSNVSNYNNIVDLYSWQTGEIAGTPSLSYDGVNNCYLMTTTSTADKLVYVIDDLEDEDDFTLTFEVKLDTSSSSYPIVGLITSYPQENLIANSYSDCAYINRNSATATHIQVVPIRVSNYTMNAYLSTNVTHTPTEWLRIKMNFDDNNGFTATFEELDGTSLGSYTGSLHDVQTPREYGIYLYSSGESYKAYIRNIIAIKN